MRLHRFNAINTHGEVVKELIACASSEKDARTIAKEKMKHRFPDTHGNYTLQSVGDFDTLSRWTKEHV